MNASTENPTSGSLDSVKWGLVVLLLAAAVVGNYFYSDISVLVRALAVVAAVVVAGLIAMQTEKGQSALSFAKESRTEVRKVVWPTRQETIQTTIIVLVATLIMSLIMYFLDMGLYTFVNFITNLQV